MKSISVIIPGAFLMVLTILTNGNAQSKKDSARFPTYKEIRGDKNEIMDHVEPRTLSNDYQPVNSKTVKVDKYWNAFNYPADSAVYILNGKQVKSQKVAKKEIDEQSAEIERVSVGEVGRQGKREIEIDYRAKSRN